MDIDVQKQGEVHVLKLRGLFRLGPAVEGFRGAVDEIMRNGAPNIVVNLTEVPSMDSSGIGALVRSQTSAKQQGGAVKLVNPTKLVLQTLKLVGLLNIFEVHTSEAEAVQSFANGYQAASSA